MKKTNKKIITKKKLKKKLEDQMFVNEFRKYVNETEQETKKAGDDLWKKMLSYKLGYVALKKLIEFYFDLNEECEDDKRK